MMDPRQRWLAWLGGIALAVSIAVAALAIWAASRQEVSASAGVDLIAEMRATPSARASAALSLARGEEIGLRRQLAELQAQVAVKAAGCQGLGPTSACLAPQAVGHVPAVAVILDTSRSMGLPRSMSAAQEQQLYRDVERQFASPQERNSRMQEIYREVREPDRRISQAKDAVSRALTTVPNSVAVTLFTFGTGTCSIENHGQFGQDDRRRLLELVAGATWNSPGTPLDQAIRSAASAIEASSPDRAGYLVVVTDGAESCGGDPCAAARAMKAERPGLLINIVDIAGNSSLQCIADATGGRLYPPSAAADLGALMQVALRPVATPDCGRRAQDIGPPNSPVPGANLASLADPGPHSGNAGIASSASGNGASSAQCPGSSSSSAFAPSISLASTAK